MNKKIIDLIFIIILFIILGCMIHVVLDNHKNNIVKWDKSNIYCLHNNLKLYPSYGMEYVCCIDCTELNKTFYKYKEELLSNKCICRTNNITETIW